MNIQKVLLKVWRAIRGFVARHIDSGVARESKKASCAALRSNASKNAFIKSSKNASRKACGSCTSRALLSLFVASATLLATFVIAPTSALSAGESAGANTVSTENTGDTKSDSAKTDGEKKQSKQSESINTELNKKNTGSSDALKKNNNKESNPVEKQPKTAGNNGVDKAKPADSDVKKNVKKQDVDYAKAVNGTDRGANEEPQLSPECKGKTFKRCYVIRYKEIKVNYGSSAKATPEIKIARDQVNALPNGVWLKLDHDEKLNKKSSSKDAYEFAFFMDKNGNNVKSTENITNSDGSIYFDSTKLSVGKYKVKVIINYPDGSSADKSASIEVVNVVSNNDLTLSVYNHQANDNTRKALGKDPIVFKDKTKDITPIFIESNSKNKTGALYHRMICHEGGKTEDKDYSVNLINGLALGGSISGVVDADKDNPLKNYQKQLQHKKEDCPKEGCYSNDYVYSSDNTAVERSQSWITGKPQNDGIFECKVFAIKDVDYNFTSTTIKKGKYGKVIEYFDNQVKTAKGIKGIFDNPDSLSSLVDNENVNYFIYKTIDWDYKTVTIQVGDKPEPPKISDNDLTLKVYPFKNDDGSLPTALSSSNNSISAILGMSLKPFVDATSAADSKNKITLRVLCSKGEKKAAAGGSGGASTVGAGSAESGSAVGGSSGGNSSTGSTSSTQSGSQSEQSSGSSQPAEDFEYKTWSSNLAELGLSVPKDTDQTRCNEAGNGDKKCTAKNVASQASMEMSIKPTKVGDYQCVVYALKPDVQTKFDGAISNATKSGGVITLKTISDALASFKENKDFAAFTFNIHSVSKFTLPHTGGQSWNLQLGILAALLVNLLAAGFVVSQSERGCKLIFGRWRGLCNHV
ncbi:hypothetical protein [Gardnerella vaginalis]|uniref:hypothetical protein n=1 Tax=Gardnerella vaginalis TaxID=2702 RepID=UPI0039F0C272